MTADHQHDHQSKPVEAGGTDPRTITIPDAPPPIAAASPDPEGQSNLPLSPLHPATAKADESYGKVSPLRRYSLRGKAEEYEARAAVLRPVLGTIVMLGQLMMLYAPPNTGKTLIVLHLVLDAIERGLINPDDVYYFNADDNHGGMTAKLRLLQDAGAHLLVPGQLGLKTDQLMALMTEAVERDAARGTLIVIDTLKKFTDLMDKRRSSEFAQVCRQYSMAGGTIVALGHTTKTPKKDGTPRYQGTTDIIEDFDASYVGRLLTSRSDAGRKVIEFNKEKKRSDSPDTVAYAYSSEPGITYEQMLASVHPVDPDDLDDYAIAPDDFSEPQVMHTIMELIRAGEGHGQMALAKAAAKACGISHKAALGVLQAYTGTTPRVHLWTYQKGNRGVRIYELIAQD